MLGVAFYIKFVLGADEKGGDNTSTNPSPASAPVGAPIGYNGPAPVAAPMGYNGPAPVAAPMGYNGPAPVAAPMGYNGPAPVAAPMGYNGPAPVAAPMGYNGPAPVAAPMGYNGPAPVAAPMGYNGPAPVAAPMGYNGPAPVAAPMGYNGRAPVAAPRGSGPAPVGAPMALEPGKRHCGQHMDGFDLNGRTIAAPLVEGEYNQTNKLCCDLCLDNNECGSVVVQEASWLDGPRKAMCHMKNLQDSKAAPVDTQDQYLTLIMMEGGTDPGTVPDPSDTYSGYTEYLGQNCFAGNGTGKQSTIYPQFISNSLEKCAIACTATADCKVTGFDGGTCYLWQEPFTVSKCQENDIVDTLVRN